MSIPRTAELPVGVEPLWLRTTHGAFAGLRAGSTGPIVLLVPGFTGSKEDFTALLPTLARNGFTAIAYDQAGQYQSPPHDGGGSLTQWADDLLSITETLRATPAQVPIHLVGHSFGGLVAREAVLRGPDGFASLTLLDSGPGALPPEHQARLQLLREIVPSHTMTQIWDLKQLLESQDGVAALEPNVASFLRHRWVESSAAALAEMALVLLTCPDRTDDLAALEVPCLVAHGVNDSTAWPLSEQSSMAERLACACVAIPDAEHSPATENPSATARALTEFFATV